MNSYQEKIEKFLKDIRSKKIEVQEDKWYEFLKSELTFPFAAKIEDIDEFSKTDLEWNDIVNVKGIDNFIDMYGILVEIRKGRRKYIFPLCDLEIIDKKSNNYFIIDQFLEWWTDTYF